jgi:hypothetical protein
VIPGDHPKIGLRRRVNHGKKHGKKPYLTHPSPMSRMIMSVLDRVCGFLCKENGSGCKKYGNPWASLGKS